MFCMNPNQVFMKKRFQHTLIPITAMLILSGLVLLVALHLRQTNNLEQTRGKIGTGRQILQNADALEQAWQAHSGFMLRYIPAHAEAQNDSMHLYQQQVASALLHMQKNTAGHTMLAHQLRQAEQAMINNESLADSLITLQQNGNPLPAQKLQACMQQTLLVVADHINILKLSVHNSMQRQQDQYMTAQKAIEHLRLGTLITLAVTFCAFLCLLYYDVHTLVAQRAAATPTLVGNERYNKAVTAPQLPLPSRKKYFFSEDDYGIIQEKQLTSRAN